MKEKNDSLFVCQTLDKFMDLLRSVSLMIYMKFCKIVSLQQVK
jgi:hypothetical protein